MKIQRIEISFPVEVETPPGFSRALDALITMVCEKYKVEHPGRTMWVFGCGSKTLFNWYTVGDDEPLKFDDSVYCIECSEREDYGPSKPLTKEEQIERLKKRLGKLEAQS